VASLTHDGDKLAYVTRQGVLDVLWLGPRARHGWKRRPGLQPWPRRSLPSEPPGTHGIGAGLLGTLQRGVPPLKAGAPLPSLFARLSKQAA